MIILLGSLGGYQSGDWEDLMGESVLVTWEANTRRDAYIRHKAQIC
jgi:hypothetical protein